MARKFWYACMIFLALATLISPVSTPAYAAAPFQSCANSILSPGQWSGQITRTVSVAQNLPGMDITGMVYFQADIVLNVTCNNVTGGYFHVSHDDFSDNVSGKISHADICHAAGIYTVTQGTISGNSSRPIISVTATVNYTTIDCPSFPGAGKVPPVTFTLPAQTASPTRISGANYDVDNQTAQMLANLEKVAQNVGVSSSWILTNQGLDPEISNLTAQLQQFFLANIPVKNTYTATVDWKNNPPGHVNWTLNNQTTTGSMNGNVSTQSYDLGQLPPGQNPLTAIAISSNGRTSTVLNGNIIIVPQDPWAVAANFQAHPFSHDVIYSGLRSYPANELKFFVSIPSAIPFIGGKWGLLPTQFNVHLSADSLGGDTMDVMEGHGGVAFGNDSFNLHLNGQSDTVLTPDSLNVNSDRTVVNLVKESKTFSQQVGLLTLVPLASTLFNVPILGGFLRAFNSIAAIHGQVTITADGNAHLGVNQDKTDLTITSGEVNTSAQVQAFTEINLGLAFAGAGGSGTGTLNLALNPAPSIKNCQLQMDFFAFAGLSILFGGRTVRVDQPFTLASCQQAGIDPGFRLVDYPTHPATSISSLTRSASLLQTEQPALQARPSSLGQATTLVEGASARSQPYLAVAPNGDMALAWMTGDPNRPVAQSPGIEVRLFHAGSWSDVINVDSGSHPDFNPTAAFDGQGNLVLVWNQSKFTSLPSTFSLDESFARSLKIAYAVLDLSSHTIKQSGLLQDDASMDFDPQIAAGSGSLWVAWDSSPSAAFVSAADQPNQLKAISWDGKQWSHVETVDDRLVGTLFISLAAAGSSGAMLAYDVDTDGNLSTSSDRKIFLAIHNSQGWAKPQRLTQDTAMETAPHAAYTQDGKPVLAWLSGDQVVGLDGDLHATPQVWVDEATANASGLGVNFGNGALAAGPGGSLALLWAGVSQTGPDVMLTRYDPTAKKWSPPQGLSGANSQPASITAGIAQNGLLAVGLAQVDTTVQPVSLGNGATMSAPTLASTANLTVIQVPGEMLPATGDQPGNGLPLPLLAVALFGLVAGLIIAVGLIFIIRRKNTEIK